MAQVITLPVQKVAAAAASATDLSTWDIDSWGRDHTLARVAAIAVRTRWSIACGGQERLPETGPALVVVNARRFMLTTWFTALALSRELDRPVRFVGRPDSAPVGAFARRLGGLLARPDEVAAALRDGQILVFGATGTLDPRRVGELDHRVIGAAVRTKSPVFPASVAVSPIGRSARIEVGAALRPPHRRRGPFAELEMADLLEASLADQLDTSGPPRTGTPLDWIPIGFSLGEAPDVTYVRTSDGSRIHYEVTGRRSAPPVLMIQGLGMDKHGWDLQRFVLALRYRVIVLDNRGAGRSDKPHGGYDLDRMADDAIEVLDHAGVDRAHIVGASMGGAISQILTVNHPERVRSLTLACTACRVQPWREELLRQWVQVAETKGLGRMTKEAARWVIGPRSFRRLVPLLGWLGPLGLGRPSHAFRGQVEAILAAKDSVPEDLATIEVPVMVIVGNQDILTPRGDSEELADRIPTAELVVISGAAHGLMIEHASTFNRVLGEFLGRAEQAYQKTLVPLPDVISAAS